MTLSVLAEQLNGELIGADVEFSRLSTDTRSLVSGETYLALCGERFDGNEFVSQAKQNGAAAAIVSRAMDVDLPLLVVPNTHFALGKIAHINRQRGKARVIALTGSQGKTTVKEMLGAILSRAAQTLVTQANLNNTIGVPLTLLQLDDLHEYAVIEIGASSPGEIAFSAEVAQPEIAMITNASAAHIEGFGSLEGIVEAKGEIIDGVSDNGTIILNADDNYVSKWIERAADRRVVLFSYQNESRIANYYATDVSIEERGQVSFKLNTPIGEQEIDLKLLGIHNVVNAISASCAAIEAGATLEEVALGLAGVEPVAGRLSVQTGIANCCLLDDTYNASPSSFFAAIDVLMTFAGRKVLVAGDMKELGAESESAHTCVGTYAAAAGVDELWAVGKMSEFTAQAFGDKGRHFTSKTELVDACKGIAGEDIVFLIKGSRGARMEKVVNDLSTSGGV